MYGVTAQLPAWRTATHLVVPGVFSVQRDGVVLHVRLLNGGEVELELVHLVALLQWLLQGLGGSRGGEGSKGLGWWQWRWEWAASGHQLP